MTPPNNPTNNANSNYENVICAPWSVFASSEGLRGEYRATSSVSMSRTLEEEISALCREFHHALGVQEVTQNAPVVLFWKAQKSAHWLVTQVLRGASAPSQRVAYEYFSLALTETDLKKLGGNPLCALEQVDFNQRRVRYFDGLNEDVCFSVSAKTSAKASAVKASAAPPFQNGTWPATEQNRAALLSCVNSGKSIGRTFATWWPSAHTAARWYF